MNELNGPWTWALREWGPNRRFVEESLFIDRAFKPEQGLEDRPSIKDTTIHVQGKPNKDLMNA